MKILLLLLTLLALQAPAQNLKVAASQPLRASQMDTLVQRHHYTWLVLWAPGCGPWEQLAGSFQQFIEQHPDKDIQLMLVAVQNAPRNTAEVLTRLNFKPLTYYVDSARYAKTGSRGFRKDLNQSIMGKKYRNANHYVWERGRGIIYTSDVPAADFTRLKTVFKL